MKETTNNKLLSIYLKHRHLFTRSGLKNHSLYTIQSLFLTYVFINFYTDFTALLFLALCVFAYTIAFCEWQLFFQLRRDGGNDDKNLFFEESAGRFRKIAFYISLALLVYIDIEKYKNNLHITARSEFYRHITVSTLDSILFSIVLIEIWRILTSSHWSNKKHIISVASLAIVFSTVRIIGLNVISAHGLF